MSTDLTRRTFLGGGALAAAVAIGSGAFSLAGCSAEKTTAGATGSSGNSSGSAGYETINTDVVVVGAGGAGVQAAISAKAEGAEVIIIDKKQWGHCGNSGLHYSGRMTSSDFGIEGDNVDVNLEDACIQGCYIVDQALGREVLEAYAEDRVTLVSENYGDLHFRDYTNGKPLVGKSSNRPRVWPGFKLNNMAYKALANGVMVMDYCTMTKIVTDAENRVVGVTALDFRTGRFYLIRAKSVVLATGGDCGLWGAASVASRYGGGCENLVGDGQALAAPLGVKFRDLEFRALYANFGIINPTGISNFGCAWCSDFANFKDNDGNQYLKAAVDAGEKVTVRKSVYEWYKVAEEGKASPHGGIFAPADTYLVGTGGGISKQGFSSDAYDQLKLTWERAGVDLSNLEAAPQQIYDYGGIITNINGETGVDGLYAAGEVAMHSGAGYGAMRMFSSALVMGKRAGSAAASRAKDMDMPTIVWDQVTAECERVYGFLENDPSTKVRPHELKHKVQDSAWKGSGALRSEKRCTEALAEFDAEESELENLYIQDKSRICNLEWMEALAIKNMITMAKMDTLASLERKESRGTHLRNEYPEMNNDEWVKNVCIQLEGDEFVVTVEDVNIVDFKPEPGKFPLGGGTLEAF
ncbi:MAG: FAD-binding protein [Actinobacteria bacterium]|nr:FAD-binding protein [Actinomycetota bacterium]